MKRGLVLGGGGLIGMGYHAGALKALEEWGVDVSDQEVLVGTSAGSVMASYIGAGWTPTDFYEYAHGRHQKAPKHEEQRDEVRRIFTPLWQSGSERARRTIGSFFAAAASRGYWAKGSGSRVPGKSWRQMFPAGMYSTDETLERLQDDLPDEWPRDELLICAVELYSGKRVVFGDEGAPPAPLPWAVLASTAIPGVFPPVAIGGRRYVDGGAYSATSLDLAVEHGCESIICVAPLGYRSDGLEYLRDPTMWSPMLMRTLFARALSREVRAARAKGVHVLVIRPWLTDLKQHGTNSMRHFDRVPLVEGAREGTLRLLEQHSDNPALKAATERRDEKSWQEPSTA